MSFQRFVRDNAPSGNDRWSPATASHSAALQVFDLLRLDGEHRGCLGMNSADFDVRSSAMPFRNGRFAGLAD